MGSCGSKPVEPVPESTPMKQVTVPMSMPPQTPQAPPPAPIPVSQALSESLSRRGHTASTRSIENLHESTRHRTTSAPQRALSTSSRNPRSTRHQTIAVPSTGMSTGSRSVPRLSIPAHTKAVTRTLIPTTHQVLSNHTKFRVLVVGKKLSGKSSLINAVFKVDTSSATGNINSEIYGDDNHYLIFHECSAFGPGEGQNLQAIRDFISHWTDPARLPTERLHAIWICVPASDVMSRSIGNGIEDLLNMRRVPTIIVFTKFDQAVTLEGGSSASAAARTRFEQSCRSLFRKEPRDVPAEIVSVKPEFADHVENLVVTTDQFITGLRPLSGPPGQSSTQDKPRRIAAAPLVWSAALRVNQDIFIQASIDVGRSREYHHLTDVGQFSHPCLRSEYWRNLWNSLEFSDQPLKECVNVIHTDIVEIWNLRDSTRCLSNSEFKAKMSHVVKDLAGSVGATPASPDFAQWVYDVYRGSQENVRCVMGYIVDLTAILDGIFSIATGPVSEEEAQTAMDRYVSSGRRDMIHGDINSFVTETFEIRFTVPQRDPVLEKIIDLIQQYCVIPSTGGYR